MLHCGVRAKCLETRTRGDYVHRRYRCPVCTTRFSTAETVEIEPKRRVKFFQRIDQIQALLSSLKDPRG